MKRIRLDPDPDPQLCLWLSTVYMQYLSFGSGEGAKEPVQGNVGRAVVAVEMCVVQQVEVVPAARPLQPNQIKLCSPFI